MVCDALGYPLKFVITGGQVHDVTQAEGLLRESSSEYVLADKGYDSNELIAMIRAKAAIPVIPCRSNRKEWREHDVELYKERNFIERTFNKLKHCRRIATRYEKTLVNFMGLVYLASSMLWLR